MKIAAYQKKKNSKSIGTIIDELLNNPEVIMVQAGRVINEAKKAEEKILNKNKELEKQLIEKDKEIAYLKGKIDVMKDFINELKNTDIEYGSIETQLLEKKTRRILWMKKNIYNYKHCWQNLEWWQ